MNHKKDPSFSHRRTTEAKLVADRYLSQMFSFLIIGIVGFLGVAWMLGRASTAPLPEQSSISLSS
jgi:hypothetical protein